MWMCRQVARALRDCRFWELPKGRKIGLLLHIYLCPMCGRYHRQVVDFHKCVQAYLEHEATDEPAASMKLSEEARAKIEASLHNGET